MDETAATRRAAHAYVTRLEQRDWPGLTELLAEDVVYEMPQTRERILGRQAFVEFNAGYPGEWHLTLRRLVADGRSAAVWLDVAAGDGRQDATAWIDVSAAGLIERITDFWPEPYDPPAGREHLTERY